MMSLITKGTSQSNIHASGDVAGRDVTKVDKLNIVVDNSTRNIYEAVKTLSSTLATVVNALGKILPEADVFVEIDEFSIEHKKDHNNVKEYRDIMDEYGPLTGKLAVVYSECEAEGTAITFNTLSNIRLQYLRVRKEFRALYPELTVIEVVRLHSDEIFERVEQRLLANVISSTNITAPIESVHLSLQVVMIDAFIKCKILEHPSNHAAS
jgi:hypothetical protein